MARIPEPFAFAHKDEFLALPQEDRPPHIWECLQYLEWRRGIGDVPDFEIDRNVGIMRHIAADVAKHLARELEKSATWKDKYDPRWPRYHPNSKDPLYLTGCHPPLLLCVPENDESWKEADFDDGQREFAEWFNTPAGLRFLNDEERAHVSESADLIDSVVEAERKANAAVKKVNAFLERGRTQQKSAPKKRKN